MRIAAQNIDGFLHTIPLPDGFADVLIISNAIGWHLEDELPEIERVVKKGGHAIHLFNADDDMGDTPLHARLVSSEWGYTYSRHRDEAGWKRKYWKQL